MKIIKVENPQYSKADNSTIDVMATFDDGRVLPYTAAAHDNEAHGKQLWAELLEGEHGAISAFVAKG
jgi:hypothetical protein